MNPKARAKTFLRQATRGLGYEIVPFKAGIAQLQSRVLRGDVGVAVDVGANVGQYAERLRDLGYRGRILSFEPGGAAFGTLNDRASRSAGSWEARRVALGEQIGEATLQVSGNSVSSSLLQVAAEHLAAAPASAVASTEVVPVSTLDHELVGEGDPLWLKLDVQGLELPVLRGGSETLARTVAVQAEVSFSHLYDGQTDWLELCGHLRDAGFVLRYMEPGYEDASRGYMLQADVLFLRDELMAGR